MRSVCVALCLIGLVGCSRTLGFNFTFGGDDLAQGTLDLAMVNDLSVGDLGAVDQAGSDQAGVDLGIPDQAMPADMTALPHDLFGIDQRTVDMIILNSNLGKECSPNSTGGCGALSCVTMYPSTPDAGTITNGYCTKECASDDPCLALGGRCLPVGAKKYCVLLCAGTCARGDTPCCNYCTTTASGTSCSVATFCAPPDVPGFCM